ncbi:MAG: pentapeptide repeat-containing protein [Candidatus Cloacimonetes bacterium]|nr:pentapeptide repeat-containing protein [Candidatus Cloacimonadota bacterium]
MYKEIENEIFDVENIPVVWEDVYSYCKFRNLDLTAIDLSGREFIECEFEDCNISLTRIAGIKMHTVTFRNCRVQGVDFTKIDRLITEMNFNNCQIRECNYSGLELKGISFLGSEISNTDFINSDLSSAVFRNVNFREVVFHNTDLKKASFLGAKGYRINPMTNEIKGGIFDLPEVVSFLEYLQITIR